MNGFVLKSGLPFLLTAVLASFLFGCSSSGPIQKMKNKKSAATDSPSQPDLWQKYTYTQRQGKLIYDHYCSGCHGSNGAGDGFNASALEPHPATLSVSKYISGPNDEKLKKVIAGGGRGTNRSVLMPAYSRTLTDAEIANVIEYIKTFALRGKKE